MVPAAVDAHEAVLTVSCLRHFPTWMTSGILSPIGALPIVKFPLVSVVEYTSGFPWKSALHEHASAPVGTPEGSFPTAAVGT
jgi:hypothetical protein